MKPPLVLLHGWGLNRRIWDSILPTLHKSFDVVVLDLPGYGKDTQYAGDYSLDAVTERICAMAPRQACWIAWSLGATIAMNAARQNPGRLLKLQLISPTPKFMSGTAWDHGMDETLLNQLVKSFDADYVMGLKRFLLLQLNRQVNSREKVREHLDAITQLPGPTKGTLHKSLRLLTDTDLRGEASKIQVRTQIMAGSDDLVVSPSASRWLSETIPDSEFVNLDSGHLPFISVQQEYLDHLHSFFEVSVA